MAEDAIQTTSRAYREATIAANDAWALVEKCNSAAREAETAYDEAIKRVDLARKALFAAVLSPVSELVDG